MAGGWPKDDFKSMDLWKAVLAELVAMILFVFLGCGSLITYSGIPFAVERVALTFGLAIASLVQVTGNISGGHINPAVSVAMLAARKISPLRCLLYVIAQVLGGITGAGLLHGVTPSANRGTLGANAVNPSLSVAQGFGCEVILTFFLVLVIFASTDPNNDVGNMAPLAIGLAVGTAHLMGVPFSGASMNPARSLGPAVVADTYADHWIYWIGPLLGGPLAALFYKYVLKIKPNKKPADTDPEMAAENPRVAENPMAADNPMVAPTAK